MKLLFLESVAKYKDLTIPLSNRCLSSSSTRDANLFRHKENNLPSEITYLVTHNAM